MVLHCKYRIAFVEFSIVKLANNIAISHITFERNHIEFWKERKNHKIVIHS
jgi:hypothetical protein